MAQGKYTLEEYSRLSVSGQGEGGGVEGCFRDDERTFVEAKTLAELCGDDLGAAFAHFGGFHEGPHSQNGRMSEYSGECRFQVILGPRLFRAGAAGRAATLFQNSLADGGEKTIGSWSYGSSHEETRASGENSQGSGD